MPLANFDAPRLHVDAPLAAGARVGLDEAQANYVVNVMRLGAGDSILVFNGRDGEWLAGIEPVKKRGCVLVVGEKAREQTVPQDLDYLFAPLKRARLDYMVQKAAELGAARLRPVLTRRTTPERVNLERMRANAIEAAEQCGILSVPAVLEPEKLETALSRWDAGRRLIVCDEGADVASPLDALRALRPGPLAVLIGPEGGFAPEEREALAAKPFGFRSAPASCAPTRPQWPHWRWSMRCSATGNSPARGK
jgi:16S rRNA (uracil1498-N3)-methyltransferase